MNRATVQFYRSAFDNLVTGLYEFQRAYKKEFPDGTSLAEDEVIGAEFQKACRGIIGMLNCAPQEIDRGKIDAKVRQIAERAGFTEDLDDPR